MISTSALPLEGQTVLVTRTETGKSTLSQLLEAQGANTFLCSTTSIQAPTSWQDFDSIARGHTAFTIDWIVFSSCNGVRWCIKRLEMLEIPVSFLEQFKIACVGQSTAASVEDLGLKVDVVPEFFQSEDLLESLKSFDLKKKHFWLPQAEESRDVLFHGLLAAGAIPHRTPVYRNVLPQQDMSRVMQGLQEKSIDWIAFTSSSGVNNFFQLLPKEFGESLRNAAPQVACIGKITAATASQQGLTVQVLPEEQSLKGLVDAMAHYHASGEELQ